MKKIKITYIFVIYILLGNVSIAQSFGFGCLGLSGIYGGYSYNYYKTTGLNEYLSEQVNNTSFEFKDSKEFKRGEGFLVGLNLFRAKFASTFVTLKGFYQFSKERVEFQPIVVASESFYELNYNYWGVGVDFGFPITNFISLKLIDGGATYADINLIYGMNSEGAEITLNEFKENKNTISYYIGSGLILNIVKNYISVEISGRYHFAEIENVFDQGNNPLLINNSKFVEKGGIQASIQLNLGIPY